jgi:trk system potassium uptake protein
MNFIVVGCGRVGSELAYRLFQRDHRVVVIDIDEKAFNNLPSDFRGKMIEGDPLSQDVLRRAGIEKASGIAMVTNSDTMNAVVGHIARTVYDIDNVVVRNYEPKWRSLYDAFHMQVVSSSSWGAQRIEEMLYNVELRNTFSAGNGEVEVYEFTIPDRWDGKQLNTVLPGENCLPVGITRAGRAFLPSDETRLEKGDLLLVSATLEGVEELRTCIIQEQEG